MLNLIADQKHVNRLPRVWPNGVTYAGKTGSISGHVHDCGILTGPRGKLSIAVLTEGFENEYIAEAYIGEIGRQAALSIAQVHCQG